MASTNTEIVWLRQIVLDMGVTLCEPTLMYCENKRVIQIVKNPIFLKRTKHIEIDCNFTHHHSQHRKIALIFISSSLHITDLFTKIYFIKYFYFLIDKLSIFPLNVS